MIDADKLTDAQLIEQYSNLETYVEGKKKALNEELAQYVEGMTAIKDALLARLNQRSPNLLMPANTKTEFGTAYRIRHVKGKVTDQTKFMNFCVDNWADFGADMLSVSAATAPLKKWMEEHIGANNQEQAPPGLEIERSITLSIR